MPITDDGTQYNKKVFVTGGSGMLGSHLIRQLTTMQCSITAVYRSAIPAIAGSARVHWLQGDILDTVFLQQAMAGIDEVYHCAAIVSFYPADRQAMIATNITGTANIVNACLQAGVQKLCYVSSVAALGEYKETTGIHETTQPTNRGNNSIYGQTKHLAETEVWRAIGEGLNAVVVNPSIILGAGDWAHGSTQIFKSAYESFAWYAESVNGFIDVVDVARAMIMLMDSPIINERFILSAENRSYKEVFTMIANAFAKKPPFKKITPLLAAIVWRLEAVKAMVSNSKPLVTKETARSATATVGYDSSKLKKYLPSFNYTPLQHTISRVCTELRERYKLQ